MEGEKFQTSVKINPKNPKPGQVPEVLLKKRKRNEESRAKSAAAELKNKKKNPILRRITFKRAEKLIKEFRTKEHFEVTLRRRAKKPASLDVELSSDALLFALRIRGVTEMHARPRRVLELLRLEELNSGTFLKLNKTTLQLLKLVEPYVTWGCPSLKTVRDLIYKRGHARVNTKQVALTDNALIEQKLGQHDIICLEDVIHEIQSVGPHFKDVTSFLWNFKLNTPNGGWKKLNRKFSEGGDYGDRGTKINALLKRMI